MIDSRFQIPITAKGVQDAVCNYRTRQGQPYSQSSSTDSVTHSPFCKRHLSMQSRISLSPMIRYGFIFIKFPLITDNFLQSINVIESPQLRAIFLMLREELKDSDIPHHTNLHEQILNAWNDHLDKLQEDMAVHSHVHCQSYLLLVRRLLLAGFLL